MAVETTDSKLVDQLQTIQIALREAQAMSAKAVACEMLKENVDGMRTAFCRPHTKEALTAFNKARGAWGDDPDLLHHLAISYHALAWDLELAGSDEANGAWRLALEYWSKIRVSREFWSKLEMRGQGLGSDFDLEAISQTRRKLSTHLLSIHLDFIAHYYSRGQLDRAEDHIDIVRSAHLPLAVRRQMDDRLYKVMTGGVDEACVNSDYEAAANTIQRFLALFPDYLPALQRLVEIYHEWTNETSALEGWETLERLQSEIQPLARRLADHSDFSSESLAIVAVRELGITLAIKIGNKVTSEVDSGSADVPAITTASAKLFAQATDWFELAYRAEPTNRRTQENYSRFLVTRATLTRDDATRNLVIAPSSDEIAGRAQIERLISDAKQMLFEARSYAKKAIDIDPDNQRAQELVKYVDDISDL